MAYITRALHTTQQTERIETSKILAEQHQCLNKLLREVADVKCGASVYLSACKDDLDEMMGSMKITSAQSADTQLKLDEQKATLDEIRSGIDQLKENLEREQAQVQSRNRAGRKDLEKAVSALAVTFTILPLVVAGTILVSVYDVATQTADLSRLLANQLKKGKRTSSALIRIESSSDMGLKEYSIAGTPNALEQENDFLSNSPKRELQSQDLTVSAEEDLGLFEKAWNSPERLRTERVRPQWIVVSVAQSASAASFDSFHRLTWYLLSNSKLIISVTVVIISSGATIVWQELDVHIKIYHSTSWIVPWCPSRTSMTLTGLGPRSHPLEHRAQLICSAIG